MKKNAGNGIGVLIGFVAWLSYTLYLIFKRREKVGVRPVA